MPILFDGSLFADYHQIYLADAISTPELPTNWTNEALTERLLAAERVVTFMSGWNTTVPVRVELHEQQPRIDIEKADHVVVRNSKPPARS